MLTIAWFVTLSHTRICIRYFKVTCAASERAMKPKVRMINSLSPKYKAIPEKNITRLLLLALLLVLHTSNVNKLMIISSMALYYGDTYIQCTDFRMQEIL